MKYLSVKLFNTLLIICILTGCKTSPDQYSISGSIKGLPSGKLYLVKVPERDQVVDSTLSRNGNFKFTLSVKNEDQLSDVTILHKDSKDTVRELNFKVNKLYNGKPNHFDYFILEKDVKIFGLAKDFHAKGFQLPAKYKIMTVETPVNGKQNWVLSNITPSFPQNAQDRTGFNNLKRLVSTYPFSYYLLKEVTTNISSMTQSQFSDLLSCFDDDIKTTPLWKNTKALLWHLSKDAQSINSIRLLNSKNVKTPIVDRSENTLNLIVFWASWCQPCLQEIPELKDVYKKYGIRRKIKMSSISFDKGTDDWLKFLKKENLPWEQFFAGDELQRREILYSFQVSSVIPVIIIMDNRGKILEKIVGNQGNGFITETLEKYMTN